MTQKVVEADKVEPALHQRWLEKNGLKTGETGAPSPEHFPVAQFEGKDPATFEKLFENIRTNVTANYYTPLYTEPYDERIFVMVCGGPSLSDHLDEIRAKSLDPNYFVVCSNMTGGYLLQNGIVPQAHFILDPQEKKKFDVTPDKTHKDVQYWISATCDPAVFAELKNQGIKPCAFLADFEAEGKAIKALQESMQPGQPGMMAIQGGTMAGLRAINLADALGFRAMEYYGFDAVVRVKDGKFQPYAYEKKRGEAVIEVQCDLCPEKFDTTLIFQRQVNEFLQWHSKMPWIDIKVIGGGLISHSYEHLKERERERDSRQSPARFTREYAVLQRALHAEGGYGVSGAQFTPTIFHAVSQLAKKYGDVTVLDYGSSTGNTMKAVRDSMWLPPCLEDFCYDPFVEEFSKEPKPADLVICTDVLEHVEPECTKAVLDHLAQLTKRLIFLSIALKPAVKVLADGRNAHINLRSSEYWLREIRKRFITSEAKEDEDTLLVVAQSIEAVKEIVRAREG